MEFDLVISRLHVKKKLVVIDVGAHHGEIIDVLGYSNRKHRFDIHALEPIAENYRKLRHKKFYWNLRSRMKIHTYETGIDIVTGEKDFYLGSADTLYTTNANQLEIFQSEFESYRTRSVPLISFHDFFEKNRIPENTEVDILKVDTEGSEFSVLSSLFETANRPNAIIFELQTTIGGLEPIVALLQKQGYEEFFIYLRDGLYTNYIGNLLNDRYLREEVLAQPGFGGNCVAFRGIH